MDIEVFNLSKKGEELIYNAKRGDCLLSAGNRKIFVNVKVQFNELQIIDEHFKSGGTLWREMVYHLK